MSKEKQIEEMAVELGCDSCRKNPCKFCGFTEHCLWIESAERLYKKGYRKQIKGEWLPYESDESYGSNDETTWYKCSVCGENAHGRCYEDEWYSAPILSESCPRCGAKMKGGAE